MRDPALRRAVLCALAGAAAACLVSVPAVQASPTYDWDRAANIKEAAVRLGNIQKRQGATKAFEFIIACYKTHGLASKYSKYFEGCIAQDYIHTQALTSIYSRVPPETLKKMRAPSPHLLAQAMGQRVSDAFAKYEISQADATELKKLVDKHGFGPFAEIVFPPQKNKQKQN